MMMMEARMGDHHKNTTILQTVQGAMKGEEKLRNSSKSSVSHDVFNDYRGGLAQNKNE